MIINNFEKYNFKNSEVRGIITFINFSLEKDVEIILHEETQDKFQQVRDLETIKSFPPLVFSTGEDQDFTNTLNTPLQVKKLTLLDGHHRFEHLNLYNYDYSIPVVLISNKDVTVQSYNSKINVDRETFIDYLFASNFKSSSSSKYFIEIEDCRYSNIEIDSIYELYDFKRKLIKQDFIIPFPNDMVNDDDLIINFTPIQLVEFYKENYLFPPKSTWISPRI
jgi:uncharacterized protein (DUF1015 family)